MFISQNFFPLSLAPPKITLIRKPLQDADGSIADLLAHPHIGVATQLAQAGTLTCVALASPQRVLVIALDRTHNKRPKRSSPLLDLFEDSAGNAPVLVGFEMAPDALHIRRAVNVDVVKSVDLGTLCAPSEREPWAPSKLINRKFCGTAPLGEIDRLWYGADVAENNCNVALCAWLAVLAAGACTAEINASLKVNTRCPTAKEVAVLYTLVSQAAALAAQKPRETPNDFLRGQPTSEGMALENARYQNRVRKSNQTTVIMTNAAGDEFTGRAAGTQGRTTDVRFNGASFKGELCAVRVVGREEATAAEKARDVLVLLVLRGQALLAESAFIRYLWFPVPEDREVLEGWDGYEDGGEYACGSGLNASQDHVLKMMTSARPLVIVQGPPGTGKTKTIAAAASVWADQQLPVWIVAQSNVAVKNIAEKLAKEHINFRIVASKEFYVEWHEHIYTSIVDRLIRTDELGNDQRGVLHMLAGARVILSTLSALANPVLDQVGIFSHVPLEKLVVDEASQINVFEFMHVFHKFRESLEKVCFFGDPMQLPPYGQDQVSSLKSIFQLTHLEHLTEFLDTQYRMPEAIGAFVSDQVYEGRLLSEHAIKTMDCVAFVDVSKGQESQSGLSWKNPEEIHTICNLVRNYYITKNFCIITPYDAQRATIERQLKAENLPYDAVFNVDSFQGNEADYVLVSVVRTTQPGFLRSLNRMNVMLTRARAGMVLVTNAAFLHGAGGPTLLGQLARYWAAKRRHETWVDWRLVAERKANLPGAPGILSAHSVGADAAVVVSHSVPRASTSEVVARTGPRVHVEAEFPALPMRAPSSRAEVLGAWKGDSSQPEAGPARRVLRIAMSGTASTSTRPAGKAVVGGANEGKSNPRKKKNQGSSSA